MNIPNESEYSITCRVASYLAEMQGLGQIDKFTHVSNETYTKYKSVKLKNKRMGVNKGVPDMIIVGKGRVLFLELKKEKGGRVSVEQQEWVDSINYTSWSGVAARIENGYDNAIAAIDEFFRIDAQKIKIGV